MQCVMIPLHCEKPAQGIVLVPMGLQDHAEMFTLVRGRDWATVSAIILVLVPLNES